MSKNSFIDRCWFWIFAWERMVRKNITSTLTETNSLFWLFFLIFAQLLSFLSLQNQSLWLIDKYKLTKKIQEKLFKALAWVAHFLFLVFEFLLSGFFFFFLLRIFFCYVFVMEGGLLFLIVCIFFWGGGYFLVRRLLFFIKTPNLPH